MIKKCQPGKSICNAPHLLPIYSNISICFVDDTGIDGKLDDPVIILYHWFKLVVDNAVRLRTIKCNENTSQYWTTISVQLNKWWCFSQQANQTLTQPVVLFIHHREHTYATLPNRSNEPTQSTENLPRVKIMIIIILISLIAIHDRNERSTRTQNTDYHFQKENKNTHNNDPHFHVPFDYKFPRFFLLIFSPDVNV